jgi:hypothetical protein
MRRTILARASFASRALAGGAVMVALAIAPRIAPASTVLSVTGGPGVDGSSALCPTSDALCPMSPDLTLVNGSNPVSGSFVYNSATGQINFDLSLAQNVTFTGAAGSETLEAGSTFSASGVWVTSSGGTVSGSSQSSGHSPVYATALLSIGSGPITDASVYIDSIQCTLGAGQCGLILGGPPSTGGLGVAAVAGQPYEGDLTLNMNVTPVPLPGALGMLLSGLLSFAGLRQRLSRS